MSSRGAAALLPVLFLGALQASPALAVTLIHSNDVLGEIEPCGCRGNPMGGMARKYHFVGRIKDPFVIQIDAGDLLFPTMPVPDSLVEQSELQAKYVIKAHNLLGHQVIVPGEKDLALGLTRFKKLISGSKAKVLAANLNDARGKRIFGDIAVFTGKSETGKPVSVGVFGIVGRDLRWSNGVRVSDSVDAARRAVVALKGKKVDYIVAATHQGLEKDEELARKVPGIDVIIGGHTQSFLQTPKKVGATTIYQSSFRNQYIGRVVLEKRDAYELTPLDVNYESAAGEKSPMDELVSEFKSSIAELNSRKDSEAAKIVSQESGAGEKYQTFPRCAECHLKQFDFWRTTSHTKAWAALVEKKQDSNRECVACHSVGMGDPAGFKDLTHVAELSGGSIDFS